MGNRQLTRCHLWRINESMENSTFGSRHKFAREAVGLTQHQVATAIGVTPNVISHYEHDRHMPRRERAIDLASILGVTGAWLILGEGPGPKRRSSGKAAAR